MTCLECAQKPARSRGLCGACYIRYLRMIADSKGTDRPIDWDDLVALGKAATSSHRHDNRHATLEELQRAVYGRKRAKEKQRCKRQPMSEAEIRQRIDLFRSQRDQETARQHGEGESKRRPGNSSSSVD